MVTARQVWDEGPWKLITPPPTYLRRHTRLWRMTALISVLGHGGSKGGTVKRLWWKDHGWWGRGPRGQGGEVIAGEGVEKHGERPGRRGWWENSGKMEEEEETPSFPWVFLDLQFPWVGNPTTGASKKTLSCPQSSVVLSCGPVPGNGFGMRWWAKAPPFP